MDWANRHALDIANAEIGTQTGIDEFFAWFNKGTSHVQLYEYVDAAFAYDYAFLLYAGIGESDEAETWKPNVLTASCGTRPVPTGHITIPAATRM